MTGLPEGPLPADYQTSVNEIIRSVGVATVNRIILLQSLEAKYKISFEAHRNAVFAAANKYLQTPEARRELDKVEKMGKMETPSDRNAKKKRAHSPPKADAKPQRNTKQKKEKKPDDYPKAPLSAYFIFAADQREKIKAAQPGISITEITKETGRLWNNISDEEKKRYTNLAEEDKKRYQHEMDAYLAKGGQKFSRGTKKSTKDPSAPKRGMTAFLFFAKAYRSKHPGDSVTKQMKDAGVEWNRMSKSEKQPYETLAANDKERYQRECQERGMGAAHVLEKPKTKVQKKDSSDTESPFSSSSDDESVEE